ALCDRLGATAGARDRDSGRRLCRDEALFGLRPDRQHARLYRLFAADLLHRPLIHPLFSITLDWLPFVYTTDIKATGFRWVIEQVRQAIMPVMVLGLFQAASMTRFVRSAMLDVIRLDYVTTARAKGLGQARVIIKHAMRNALIPVVTLVALQMPAVFGGAIVTEQIFRIPGIGSLLISSILSNDTPVVMAVTFVFACLVVLFNLIADVLYGWLDPRISLR